MAMLVHRKASTHPRFRGQPHHLDQPLRPIPPGQHALTPATSELLPARRHPHLFCGAWTGRRLGHADQDFRPVPSNKTVQETYCNNSFGKCVDMIDQKAIIVFIECRFQDIIDHELTEPKFIESLFIECFCLRFLVPKQTVEARYDYKQAKTPFME